METYEYDCVIVGGGPAGLVTARYISEAGFSVAVLERDREIGVPVLCGEGVSRNIDNLGVTERKDWVENEIVGARIFSPNGTMVKMSAERAGGETGYVIDRERFDKELARIAAKKGADIFVMCDAKKANVEGGEIREIEAKLDGKDVKFTGKIFVGADGVESKVGRWVGIDTRLKPKDIVSCYEYTLSGVECDKDYTDFFVGRSLAPGGYVWIFPKSDDTANVGIGVLASYSKSGLARQLLDKFIEKRDFLRKGKPVRKLAGAAPVALPIQSYRGNVVLVGDAARHTDPLTGGGIIHAVIGGRIAGETIARALREEKLSLLEEYEKGWREKIGKKLERNYKMKELASTFDDKTFDKLADSVKDINFEELSTLGLIKALVTKHPSLLFKLKSLIG